MTAEQFVERVASRYSGDWDVGTEENRMLAQRLSDLRSLIEPWRLHPDGLARILAVVFEDTMHLDTDDAGQYELEELFADWLREVPA